jgi:hypothetical protein
VNGASERGLGRGVLHQDLAAGRFQLSRHRPSAALRPFIDFHWIVRWDLSGQQPYEQKILPHPNVNLAFEESGSAVFGVDRKLFVRRIGGQGKALGVRFSPGGFRPFWNAPVSRLTDRTIPAAEVRSCRRPATPRWSPGPRNSSPASCQAATRSPKASPTWSR